MNAYQLLFPWLRQGGRRGKQFAEAKKALQIIGASLFLTLIGWNASEAANSYNISAFAPGNPVDDQAAEAAYLAAVAAGGHGTFFEGFTGSQWDTARSTVVGGTHVATSIDSQGITWHSSAGDFITTSDASSGVTSWHIYSKGGSPQETLHAVPATIIGESNRTLFGLGFWASGGPPAKGKLQVILDDATTLGFQQVVGYEGNPPEPVKETLFLQSGKQFFGVYAPEGFSKFQLLEQEGVLEDQVLMWAADFTFAVPEPNGTLLMVLGGLILSTCFAQRRSKA